MPAASLLGALAAAVPGFIDYFLLKGGRPSMARVGRAHMALSLAAFAVFAVSLWVHMYAFEEITQHSTFSHLILSIGGVGLILASFRLGRQLVYLHGVGVQARGRANGPQEDVVDSIKAKAPKSFDNYPIHPMLVMFPASLWIVSLIFDVTTLLDAGGPPYSWPWAVLAALTLVGGLLGALVAAVSGFIDYFSCKGGEPLLARTIGARLVLTLTAIAIATTNLLWRWTENNIEPTIFQLALSISGLTLILASAWLGWRMVYVHVDGQYQPPPPR